MKHFFPIIALMTLGSFFSMKTPLIPQPIAATENTLEEFPPLSVNHFDRDASPATDHDYRTPNVYYPDPEHPPFMEDSGGEHDWSCNEPRTFPSDKQIEKRYQRNELPQREMSRSGKSKNVLPSHLTDILNRLL